jgi:hypothetical protein
MRLEELVTVQIRQVSQDQIQVSESKITVNLDAVCGIAPTTIPSDITGPDGAPIGTPACTVLLPGGQFIVKKSYQEMKAMLIGMKLVSGDGDLGSIPV